MSSVRNVERHVYKLYLASQKCEDNDVVSGIVSDAYGDCELEELSDLCDCLQSLVDSAQDKLKSRLRKLGFQGKFSGKLIPALGLKWHIVPASDKFDLVVHAKSRVAFKCLKSSWPAPIVGVLLFKTIDGNSVIVSDGIEV